MALKEKIQICSILSIIINHTEDEIRLLQASTASHLTQSDHKKSVKDLKSELKRILIKRVKRSYEKELEEFEKQNKLPELKVKIDPVLAGYQRPQFQFRARIILRQLRTPNIEDQNSLFCEQNILTPYLDQEKQAQNASTSHQSNRFMIMVQPSHTISSIDQIVYNIRALSAAFVHICMGIFKSRVNYADRPPLQTEYRLALFVKHLIFWEVFAIFFPQYLTTDPLHLLTYYRGGGFFQQFCQPNGLTFTYFRVQFKLLFQVKQKGRQTFVDDPSYKSIMMQQELLAALIGSKNNEVLKTRMKKGDTKQRALQRFHECWLRIVPRQYKGDRVRADTICTLMQFRYCLKHVEQAQNLNFRDKHRINRPWNNTAKSNRKQFKM